MSRPKCELCSNVLVRLYYRVKRVFKPSDYGFCRSCGSISKIGDKMIMNPRPNRDVLESDDNLG